MKSMSIRRLLPSPITAPRRATSANKYFFEIKELIVTIPKESWCGRACVCCPKGPKFNPQFRQIHPYDGVIVPVSNQLAPLRFGLILLV